MLPANMFNCTIPKKCRNLIGWQMAVTAVSAVLARS